MKYQIDKSRAISWSQISSWEYDREKWFSKYILNQKDDGSSALLFGKEIGDAYEYGPTFQREYKIESKLGDIRLIGYIDAFDLKNKKLIELKTGKKWDKKKAESHGQIDLYCAMLYAMHKIRPEELDINIIWLATQEMPDFSTQFVNDMKPVIFPIKKTMLDVVNMLSRVKRVVEEMEKYIKKYE